MDIEFARLERRTGVSDNSVVPSKCSRARKEVEDEVLDRGEDG